jgi:competence protein ComGF
MGRRLQYGVHRNVKEEEELNSNRRRNKRGKISTEMLHSVSAVYFGITELKE